MFAAKLTALALLVVALIAGVSVAVPVLDAPPPSDPRAPMVVGDDPTSAPPEPDPRDRPDREAVGELGRNEGDDQESGRADPDGDDDGGDADDDATGPTGVQVIRPRPAEPDDDDGNGDGNGNGNGNDDDDDTDSDDSEGSDDEDD